MAGKAEGRMGVGSLNMAKKLAPSAVVSAGSHGSQRSQQWGPGAQVWIPGQSLRPLRGVAGCLGGGGGRDWRLAGRWGNCAVTQGGMWRPERSPSWGS